MWLKHTAIILGLFTLIGIGIACSKYRGKIHGPIINSEMQSQIVHLGTLHFGETRKGDLSKGPFLAYSFYSPSKAVVELIFKAVRRPSSAYMALYGPRSDTGQFEEGILVKPLDREKNSMKYQTVNGGEYLILIVHEKSSGNSYPYEITLRCLDGCQLPLCQTLDERGCPDLYCPTGIKKEQNGCTTCGCKTSELCGPGAISIGGKCIPDCICPVPYEPVCGADGVTYSSPCEASCKGIEVIAKGTCLETCGPFTCDKSCLFGFKGDAKGCPLCECNANECKFCDNVYKPVCGSDGVTHLNMCRLACAGARFLYYGPCLYPTCEIHCPVTCKTPLMACNKDCPLGVVVDTDNCHTCECYEPCRDTAECTVHQPVCAVKIQGGKLYIRTFLNACAAECRGFNTLFKRVCPFMCENDMDCPMANTETATNPYFKCVSIYALIQSIIDPNNTAGDVESPGICVFRFKELPCGLASEDPNQCPSGRVCKEVDGKGLCVSRCKCGRILDPVCDVDGISYLNECDAFCANKKIAHPGPCCKRYVAPSSGTGCTNGEYLDIYGCHTDICRVQSPLCGINCKADVVNAVCAEGEIYDNACFAHCEGHQTDIDYPVLDDGVPNPEVCE